MGSSEIEIRSQFSHGCINYLPDQGFEIQVATLEDRGRFR